MNTQSEGVPGRPGAGPRIAVLVVEAVACSATVFLHGRFGRRYLGLRAAAVVPLVLLYAPLWGRSGEARQSPGPMFAFLAAYLVLCLKERAAGVLRRRREGHDEHGLYDGRPALLRVLPFAGEAAVKKLVEPVLLFGGGCLTVAVNAPLGLWMVMAAFCLMATACLRDGWDRRRADDLADAMLAQRQLAVRVRGVGRNRG